jgi:O-antigen/teichoic acid export membrane protein
MSRLTTKAFWIFLGDGGVRLFGFFTSVYLARTLGADQYGIIIIALSILGYAVWFSDLGLSTLGIRNMALPADKRSFKPESVFWSKVVLSVIVLIISMVVVTGFRFDNPDASKVIYLFLLSLVPHAFLLDWYYNGTQKFHINTSARLLQAACYFGLVIYFVTPDGISKVPLAYITSITVSALVMFLFYKERKSLSGIEKALTKFKEMVKAGFTLGSGTFFTQVVVLLPALVIGYFTGTIQAGWYGAAFKIILLVMLADRILITLLLPNLSRIWHEDRKKAQMHLQHVLRWVLFISCTAVLVLYTSSDFIIEMIFGEEYAPSAGLLSILCLFLPFTFINSIYMFGLIAFGDDDAYLRSTIKGGVVAMFMILFFTYYGGLKWAAIAVVLSEMVITFSVYLEFRKHMYLKTQRPLLMFGLPMLALLIIPMAGYMTFPISFLLLPGLYIIAVFLFRAVNKDDIQWLKNRLFG